jgi:hypothetical protein
MTYLTMSVMPHDKAVTDGSVAKLLSESYDYDCSLCDVNEIFAGTNAPGRSSVVARVGSAEPLGSYADQQAQPSRKLAPSDHFIRVVIKSTASPKRIQP